jgi:ABC-type multidrug transport system fused ATPase/permease subunit
LGTFDVLVRDFNDTDRNPLILEKFSNCTLNKGDSSYLPFKIGSFDGGYVSKSKYITVLMAEDEDIEGNKNNDEKRKLEYTLENVSFNIQPGQKVALVGFSGSGKSTVIKLLERFYEPTKGNIYIDGIDIKDYNLLELRKQIGLVGQEPALFRTNIFNNIKYGQLNSKKDLVIQAAKNASIDYLFDSQSNSEISSDTKSIISGGEKQRVSIARAFLKNPKILLLDEPTSALDRKNEIELTESLDKLMKGRTTFIVTHRLDSIINADVILVFENGRLIQKGTHNELINQEGEYKHLFFLN